MYFEEDDKEKTLKVYFRKVVKYFYLYKKKIEVIQMWNNILMNDGQYLYFSNELMYSLFFYYTIDVHSIS